MSRLDAIRTAARPKMHGRALISGPSGGGKTWTSLSMAQVLAEGELSRVLVIDTERESALTYADVFVGFKHLPWRPPFDPTELADTLGQLGEFAVVICDSFSHFWRGLGGTLDIADGKFGGWKTARPAQERLVQAVLAVPAHVLLCVRSKMDYLVSADGKNVTKLGMAPIQDDTLVYEVNIALDIDLEHRTTVTKSRTPAVPVGRMYPAGMERKAAEDYAGWLAGGVPPAAREDVDRIVGLFSNIADAEQRAVAKHLFVESFGMPQTLTAEVAPEAEAWLSERLGLIEDTKEGAGDDGPDRGGDAGPVGETTRSGGPLDVPSGDGADSHDVGRTGPESAPTETGEGASVAQHAGVPDPGRPIDAAAVGMRANAVFAAVIDPERIPRRKKGWLFEALRHALVFAVTDGEVSSASDADGEQLFLVWQQLDAIATGEVTFEFNARPNAGVDFHWPDGSKTTVLWTELTIAEATAEAEKRAVS